MSTLDIDIHTPNKTSKSGVERMLEFGRELFQLSQRLEKEQGTNEVNQKMLEVSSYDPFLDVIIIILFS